MKNTAILSLLLLSACLGRAPPDLEPALEGETPCAGGNFANPAVDPFGPCPYPAAIARHDADNGTIDLWRCEPGGHWVPVEGRCRWYDGDQIWCGCGIDDGAGPAP